MRQLLLGGLVMLASLAFAAQPVRARIMAPAPVPERVAVAECVVAGKVTAIEEKTVSVPSRPGAPDRTEYAIAVVKIDEAFVGATGLTHLRIGFSPQANTRFPQLNLKAGQEACFFLKKHPAESFYVTQMYFDVLDKQTTPTFDKELAVVRQCAKLLKDPSASLKAGSADDRLFTAAMLVTRYRTPPTGSAPPHKTEPIDAEQSKLILQALADADWSKASPQFRITPLATFYRLALKPEDGWTTPKKFQEVPDAAKKWLRENAGKYRIERFVAGSTEKP